jgi:hypothetical protein
MDFKFVEPTIREIETKTEMFLKVGETTILVPNSVDIPNCIVEFVDMIFDLKMEPTINNVMDNFGEGIMVQMILNSF